LEQAARSQLKALKVNLETMGLLLGLAMFLLLVVEVVARFHTVQLVTFTVQLDSMEALEVGVVVDKSEQQHLLEE
jgi:hypothetical protein